MGKSTEKENLRKAIGGIGTNDGDTEKIEEREECGSVEKCDLGSFDSIDEALLSFVFAFCLLDVLFVVFLVVPLFSFWVPLPCCLFSSVGFVSLLAWL
ncbi:hypothetical protein QYF36_006366 [Acer negundo]|nr:hypothetical protein QYF36_006366 [Acer negundo]